MQVQKDETEYMDRRAAAKYIGFAHGTLAVWDCNKRYDLKPIKIGRSVRYTRANLDAFMQQQVKPDFDCSSDK
jgi:predicted DNA-binding transcriptional regulator AlpA